MKPDPFFQFLGTHEWAMMAFLIVAGVAAIWTAISGFLWFLQLFFSRPEKKGVDQKDTTN